MTPSFVSSDTSSLVHPGEHIDVLTEHRSYVGTVEAVADPGLRLRVVALGEPVEVGRLFFTDDPWSLVLTWPAVRSITVLAELPSEDGDG